MTQYNGTQWYDEPEATVYHVSDEVRAERERKWETLRYDEDTVRRAEDLLQSQGYPIIRTTKETTL